MDLGQLKYFVKIVEHQSFTKAAQDCSVSQPALSQQIAKLEKELGQPLFERQGRSIQITAAGSLLKGQADRILRLVDDAKRQITDDGQTGQVNVAAIPTIGPYLLSRLVDSLSLEFPSARFAFREDTSENVLKSCEKGDVNLAIIALPAEAKYLSIEPLYREELMLALPREHFLCNEPEIQLSHLQDEPFIFLNDAHCLVENIESFCNQQRFQPTVTTVIEQLLTVQNLVAYGHGISFIPKMATGQDCDGRIVYRSLDGSRPYRTIAVCSNPYRYQSQLLRNILKATMELLYVGEFNHSTCQENSNLNPIKCAP